MRTKTLLIAAAALAAAVTSSQAQSTVYSQNIVGYVNQVLPGNGSFTMAVAPLVGSTNAADAIIPAIQTGDTLYIWTGTGYYSSTYIGGNAGPQGQNWFDQYNNWTNAPALSSGQGFFYSTGSGSQETNTWTGSVLLTNSIPLAGNGAFSMVGSTPPIGGLLDSTNFNLPLQTGDTLYIWTGNAYYSSTYIGGNAGPQGQNWFDQYNNWTNAPTVTVGQGFFYSTGSGSAEVWNQNLVIQ
jgi:hypothetical protein